MFPIWFLVGIAAFVLVGLVLTFREWEGGEAKLPYAKKKYLLTQAEASFFLRLENLYGEQYRIFPQIHLASLMYVEKETDRHRAHFNRIIGKSVDFVLCGKDDLTLRVAIELDDRLHQRPAGLRRDKFVEEAFRVAGLPLVHISTVEMGDDVLIRQRIDASLVVK